MTSNEAPSMRELFKFTLPLMGMLITTALLLGNDKKLWAVFPALLIALYFSAADIRMEGNRFYYRHFFSWRRLPDDISDARCTLLPALGYIRFRHFFAPLGVLFFIVERGNGSFIPFCRTALMREMLSLPRSQRDEPRPRINNDVREGRASSKARFARVLYTLLGGLAGILTPVPWQHWTPSLSQGLLVHFLQVQDYPVVLCLYVGLLIVLIITNRSHNSANFGLAFLIGGIAAHLIHLH